MQRTTSSVQFDSGASELPVHGDDTVAILTHDHVVIKRLLSELTQGAQAQRKSTLEQLKRALTIHNATEENLVYPALQVIGGKKKEAEHLYHETAEAAVLVFQLDTMLKTGDDAAFGVTAEKLQTAILEHIDDEERKAFPDLQKHAEPAQAQLLTASVREFRGSMQMQPAAP